ncbi:sulfatase family protein [Niabella hirudinis]|uniref:sulfatase family protein n=1 Tax=Niabella hirudinis TaxID=1285929 RepID=UPI003EB6F08F
MLKIVSCVALLLFAGIAGAQTGRPNIIYILADDLGYGDVSACNKNSKLHTVNMDQLAKEGMLFTDAHSSSAVCTPTRYGILTGRYNWRTHLQKGVLGGDSKPLIATGRSTVAGMLKRAGYQTACIGKWHLGLGWQKDQKGNPDYTRLITKGPVTVGFDYFYGIPASLDMAPYVYVENDHITATSLDSIKGQTGKGFWRAGLAGNDFKHAEVLPRLTQKATDYIKDHAGRNAPFFLYLALPAPHTPILPSPAYRGKSHTNEYGDFVLMTDDMVGRVMQAVKDAGIENNTLVIFTSDNGCSPQANFEELAAAGHHPSYSFRGEKADIFEGGHRVPFLVKWPGKIMPGGQCGTTICLTDFMATAAAIAGTALKDNEGEDSYSLLPLLTKKDGYGRIYTIHHSIDGNFSIRKDKWKLEFAYGSGGWSLPKEKEAKKENLPAVQLYDLSDDIAEKKNIAGASNKVVNELTRAMQTIIDNGRSTPGKPQANDVRVNYLKYQ